MLLVHAVAQSDDGAFPVIKGLTHGFIQQVAFDFQVQFLNDVILGAKDIKIGQRIAVFIHIHGIIKRILIRQFFLASKMHQDLILQTFACIGGKTCPLFDIEGVDGFDESNGANTDEVLLFTAVRVIFFHDMRYKTEVMLDQLGARGLISLPAKHKQTAFLFLAQRRRKGRGGRSAQKQADQFGKNGNQKGEHRISPLILYALRLVNMLYANRSDSLRTCLFSFR